MKTFIFFLALLFSITFFFDFVAELVIHVVNKCQNDHTIEYLIWIIINSALWTYFYYL